MQVNIFWFRRDLRLFDNHGLDKALSAGLPVLPVFIFDKNILGALDPNDRRVSFIHDTLMQLQQQLIKNNSSLLVLHDSPLKAFQKLITEYEVKEVFTNHDYEPYAIERDKDIAALLKKSGIGFSTCKDQVIFEKSEVVKADGTPYTIFTPYSKIWKQKLAEQSIAAYDSENKTGSFLQTSPLHFPTLKEIGFNNVSYNIPEPVIDPSVILNYHATRNIPSINGTSRLSVHLRFGTVSVRQLVKLAVELNEQWLNELIWREFFMSILFHFPYSISGCFKKKYDNIKWRNDAKEFEAWCKGETGYPIVDAGMRELNETGFMHNRVRMIVASFLTKHLLTDWRMGEAWFAEKLFDYELSSNIGNWQWAAGCGCDAAPYFRIFNPAEQTKKFDPDFIYIKKWIHGYQPGYLPEMVEHSFARNRALEVFKKYLN